MSYCRYLDHSCIVCCSPYLKDAAAPKLRQGAAIRSLSQASSSCAAIRMNDAGCEVNSISQASGYDDVHFNCYVEATPNSRLQNQGG